MKLKITEPGWAGYTGPLGYVEFVNGVSVDEVGRADAAALAGIVSIEEVGTGKNPSDSQRMIDSRAESLAVDAPVAAVLEPVVAAPSAEHTRESLEAVADASGIKGIREIADPMGLKANSMTELIDKILNKQSTDAADAAAQGELDLNAAAAAQPDPAPAVA